MAKFKVGDRVRLIRDDSGIKEGMTGTVTNVEGALHVPFRPDRITGEECHPYTNGSFAVDEEDLELITASTPQPKFKVGDRVRIRSSATGIYHRLSTGMTGTVDQNYSTCPWVRWDKMLGDNRWCIDQDDLELIEEPQYTQLHPKVGDKFRVLKELTSWCGTPDKGNFYPVGSEVEMTQISGHEFRLKNQRQNWCFSKDTFTTEYLEPIEATIKVGGMMAEFKPYQYRPDFIIFDECEAEPINKPKKLTFMQTLTSALKRVLSPQLQKFYKVGYINTGLTLTSTGREQYIEALFQNAGDHAKALKDMEATADDMIAQADKE